MLCEVWSSSTLNNCSIEEVSIGNGSFANCEGGEFEVSECERLGRMIVGSGCCVNWSSFVLRNCGVEEVSIGDGCFVSCENTVFESECSIQV